MIKTILLTMTVMNSQGISHSTYVIPPSNFYKMEKCETIGKAWQKDMVKYFKSKNFHNITQRYRCTAISQ